MLIKFVRIQQSFSFTVEEIFEVRQLLRVRPLILSPGCLRLSPNVREQQEHWLEVFHPRRGAQYVRNRGYSLDPCSLLVKSHNFQAIFPLKVSKSRKKNCCHRFSKKTNAGAFLCTEKCPSIRFFGESRTTNFFFEIY